MYILYDPSEKVVETRDHESFCREVINFLPLPKIFWSSRYHCTKSLCKYRIVIFFLPRFISLASNIPICGSFLSHLGQFGIKGKFSVSLRFSVSTVSLICMQILFLFFYDVVYLFVSYLLYIAQFRGKTVLFPPIRLLDNYNM